MDNETVKINLDVLYPTITMEIRHFYPPKENCTNCKWFDRDSRWKCVHEDFRSVCGPEDIPDEMMVCNKWEGDRLYMMKERSEREDLIN